MKFILYVLLGLVILSFISFAAITSIVQNSPADGFISATASNIFNYTASSDLDMTVSCNISIDDVKNGATDNSVTSGQSSTFSRTLSEGAHNWSIQCADSDTNVVDSGNFAIFVDTSAPSVTLNSPANNFLSNSSDVDFEFTTIDNFASDLSCDFYLDGSLENSIAPVQNNTATNFSIFSIPDGLHTWNVVCVDEAENAGNGTLRNITVDTTAPTITILAPPSNTHIAGGNISFVFNAIDNIDSSFVCSLVVDEQLVASNDSVENNTETTFNHVLSSDRHSWYINCTDSALNQGSSSSYVSISSSNTKTSGSLFKSMIFSAAGKCSQTLLSLKDSSSSEPIAAATIYAYETAGYYSSTQTTNANGEITVASCGKELRLQFTKEGYTEIDTKITPACSCGNTVPECTIDSDCNDSLKMCQNLKCVFKTTTPTCTKDTDCSSNQMCQAGKCIAKALILQCSKDSDCAKDQMCKNNNCVAKPTPNFDISAPTGTVGTPITISFTDNGTACKGCQIQLTGPTRNQITATTNDNGQYTFTPVDSGTYTISLFKEGQVVKTVTFYAAAAVTNSGANNSSATTPATSAQNQPKSTNDFSWIIILIVVILLIAGGVYWYMNQRK